MKMPDCFEAYRILPLLAAGLLVAGCDSGDISTGGSSGGCTSSFPQPSGFEQEFDTFTIGENTAENPAGADLDKTLLRQFFQAAAPPSGDQQAQDLYTFMANETDPIANFDDTDSLPAYKSVRNGFDLFEAMIIASNQFDSLQIARDAMASCARDTQEAFAEGKNAKPGSIMVSNITVTETPESEDEDPVKWSFQVNYAHNPDPLDFATPFGPNVGRVLFTPDSFVRTLYDYEDFTGNSAATGFKQPAVLVAGFNASLNDTLEPEDGETEDQPSVIFESFTLESTEDDRGQERGETDRWSWSSEEGTPAFAGSDEEPDRCIRVTVDYSDDAPPERVNVQFSKERCPLITETEEFQEDRAFNYTPDDPTIVQTR